MIFELQGKQAMQSYKTNIIKKEIKNQLNKEYKSTRLQHGDYYCIAIDSWGLGFIYTTRERRNKRRALIKRKRSLFFQNLKY